MDECSASKPVCHVNAQCQNNIGSYSCSCYYGYMGDGITNCVPVPTECQNYQNLTGGDRKNTYSTSEGLMDCNYHLNPGWYRFHGDAGTKMATTCVLLYHRGTHAPGWLNGAHPTLEEGQVTRQVCFSWSDCCTWAINVHVRNCVDYFVYYINRTPSVHTCHLRYCGAD
ncbi:pancreatic secretory granule membrane major glycoprotein GP2-like [Oculina patagonica]